MAVRRSPTRPVLIVGVNRSGTTWIGDVLSQSYGVHAVMEPDTHHQNKPDRFAAAAKRGLGFMPVLTDDRAPAMYSLLWDVAFAGGWPRRQPFPSLLRTAYRLPPRARAASYRPIAWAGSRARRIPEHVVIKSVHCIFALDWIAARYNPHIIVVRRNLYAVANSHAERWSTEPRGLWHVPGIRERVVEARGLSAQDVSAPAIQQKAWELAVQTRVLEEQCRLHSDWHVVWHEDVSRDPLAIFQKLAGEVDLPWDERSDEYLADNLPGSQRSKGRDAARLAEAWRGRFTADEIAALGEVFDRFGLDPRATATKASAAALT